ncbi:Hpt domain-containing protein [Planomonospora venezuelensis]|uniref:HPt (Histidine-containing phosphotransfer) domain-containing protein n=1 Tax=Planomonospora venezuelensis TaxID=1999 RepID=A0A841DCB4_PLAVE|nr:Hpt domain-containing protein [Planomonospora venezuelensis]MBB5967129.1 HPt (histidine-containing phosphotransfer) domain-containing protein [Planomonospora venezuelensis]GIN04860.1 hypothetical protein Pve01_65180 [Planomonospora venezuelensis]
MTVRGTTLSIRARIADLIEDDTPEEVAFTERLIVSFLDRAPVLLADLTAAIGTADLDAAVHWAHTLKGASANLGVDTLASLCAEAERLAEEARSDLLAAQPALLESALAEAGTAFAEVLGDLRSGRPTG